MLKQKVNMKYLKSKILIGHTHKLRTFQTITTWPNEDGSKEIRLKTPWGHIAGKKWGPDGGKKVLAVHGWQDNCGTFDTLVPLLNKNLEIFAIDLPGKKWGPDGGKKVLAVHGWQDNCGTFDTLVPLLNKNLEIFAIDLPGHGMSSHYPKGIINYYGEYLAAIHRIVKILDLGKFIYLGHSLGAIFGYMYAATFPELIDQYIAIENMKPVTIKPSELHKRNREAIEGLLKLETKKDDASFKGYSKTEAVKRMVTGYFDSITPESANILLKRGLKLAPSGEGYSYSRDLKLKLKSLELGPSTETLIYYGSNIKCDILHIKARPGIDYESIELYRKTVEELRKTASSVTYHEVEGTHHVHLNNPEIVAPLINKFIRV